MIAVGERFGRLVVVAEVERVKRRRRFLCRCDCGSDKTAAGFDLRRGDTQSCGCLARELAAARCAARATHGHGYTRGVRRASATYDVWSGMRQRCTNPRTAGYPNYGGRGITVCDRWSASFENFLADMGEKPAGRTLDRIDVNGNYEPGNCRWATAAEQSQNRRDNVLDEEKVRALKALLATGARVTDAARSLGIGYGPALSVKQGKSWRNVA